MLDKRIISDTKICLQHCEKCFHVIVVVVSDKLSIYLRGRTGMGRSVSPLQVYISQSTWCTQPQQYRGWTVHLYSDLTNSPSALIPGVYISPPVSSDEPH